MVQEMVGGAGPEDSHQVHRGEPGTQLEVQEVTDLKEAQKEDPWGAGEAVA